MTESETEAETIDRLEAALRKIAAAASAAKSTAARHGAAPEIDTAALKATLDHLITRLRAGLSPDPAHHVITE